MKWASVHISCLLVGLLSLAGCSSGGSTYPSVQLAFVTAKTDAGGKVTGFTTDKGRFYAVGEDASSAVYSPDTTKRIIANYELRPSEENAADTVAYLYASAATISPLPQPASYFKEGIKNDPAEVLSGWMGRNYLNIVLNILSQSAKHSIAFVEQSVTTDAAGRRTVSLLLYHNSNNDVQAYTQRAYLSIPLHQYAGSDNSGATIVFSLYTNDGSLKSYTYDYRPQ
jgi:hypothetical protein